MNNLAAPTTATPPRLGPPQDVPLNFGLNKLLGKKALSGNVNRDGKDFAKAPGSRKYVRLSRTAYEQLRKTHSANQVERYQRTLCDAAREMDLAKADAAFRVLKKKAPRGQDVQVQIHVADNAESRCRCAEIKAGLDKLRDRGLKVAIVVTSTGPGVNPGMGGPADQAEMRGLLQAHTVAEILLDKAKPVEAMDAFSTSLSNYLVQIAATNSLDPLPSEIERLISLSFGGNRTWSQLPDFEKASLIKGLCDGLRRVGEHYEKRSGDKGALLGFVQMAVAGKTGTIAGLQARFGGAANNGAAPQNAVANNAPANVAPPPALAQVKADARAHGVSIAIAAARTWVANYDPTQVQVPLNQYRDHMRNVVPGMSDTDLVNSVRANDAGTITSVTQSLTRDNLPVNDANLAAGIREYCLGYEEGLLDYEQALLARQPADFGYPEQQYCAMFNSPPLPVAPPVPAPLAAPPRPTSAAPLYAVMVPPDKQTAYARVLERMSKKGEMRDLEAFISASRHYSEIHDMLDLAGMSRSDLRHNAVDAFRVLVDVAEQCSLSHAPQFDLKGLHDEAVVAETADLALHQNGGPFDTDRLLALRDALLRIATKKNQRVKKLDSQTLRLVLAHLNLTRDDLATNPQASFASLAHFAVGIAADPKVIRWLRKEAAAAQARAAAAPPTGSPPMVSGPIVAPSAPLAPVIDHNLTAAYLASVEQDGRVFMNNEYANWLASIRAGTTNQASLEGKVNYLLQEKYFLKHAGIAAGARHFQMSHPQLCQRLAAGNAAFTDAQWFAIYEQYLEGTIKALAAVRADIRTRAAGVNVPDRFELEAADYLEDNNI